MIRKIVLDNGLTLILNQDKTKHQTLAKIIIQAGGIICDYLMDGKPCHTKHGVAHFLEHYLLEHSIYGNYTDFFEKNFIFSNGITYPLRTCYYIKTVHDFEDNFKKLLDIVHKPVFNQENIHLVKGPILSEIEQKNDTKMLKHSHLIFDTLFHNDIYNKILGEKETVQNMTVEDLETFHKAFYIPSNEIIAITGNFDDSIIDRIQDYFEGESYPHVEIKPYEEPKKVNKSSAIYHEEDNENYFTLTFKLDLEPFTPLERNKIDYYLAFVMDTYFGETSSLFKYLMDEKLTTFNLNYTLSPRVLNNYALLSITAQTNKQEEVLKLILDKIKNLEYSEQLFTEWINNTLISSITRSEQPYFETDNYIHNILFYDLYAFDDIDYIKSLTLKEAKSLLERVEFQHYSVVYKQ